jgi:hypothetical protein
MNKKELIQKIEAVAGEFGCYGFLLGLEALGYRFSRARLARLNKEALGGVLKALDWARWEAERRVSE